MDKRLVIPPWKVDLVQRYFSEDKKAPGRKEKSNSADVSPPPLDHPKSISMVLGETGGPGFQKAEEWLCSSITTSTPPVRLRICRPKLTSKMKKPQGEGKDGLMIITKRL